MKTILLLLAVNVILLFSCQQAGDKSAHEASHEHEMTAHAEQNGHEHAVGDKKWQTDESTRMHVRNLHTQSEAFKLKKDADVASYKAFGKELSEELNKLVSDCKMDGPAHDALHGWLTPVLDQVAALNKAETLGQGKLAAAKIEDSLRDFYARFE